MNVYENIPFPLKVCKKDPATHDEKVRRASAMVELDDFLNREPADLSGSQRQRVALARAVVREPNVFLMDEPLSNLDAKLRVSTRAQIKNLQHKLKATTIYVTHDQIEAMTFTDRVVVMSMGVIQQVGTPTEIYDFPANAFVAGFIGSPAMNLMEGLVKNGAFIGENVQLTGLKAVDGPVTLGFRAEDTAINSGQADIFAPAYTMELLGDQTLIAVRVGGTLVSVKAHKEFRAAIGEEMTISVQTDTCHLFDSNTGARIEPV